MVIVSAFFISSCTNDLKEYYGREGDLTMRPSYMGDMPNGDDPYSQGVRDGCNTAIATIGTGPMAASYDPMYYDFDKSITDSEYYKGRTTGFNYCTFYQDPDPF